jgi:hypothetical protein
MEVIMATKQMNMHRLLSELKMLDKRITGYVIGESDIRGRQYSEKLQLIGAAREIDQKIGTQTREEYTATLRGNWQMIRALIRNKKSLEAAKVKSNAETIVRIAGVEYTVADAIKRKEDIDYDKELLHLFEMQQQNVIASVENANETAERQADKHVEALFNGQSGKNDASICKEAEQQRENYMKNHRWGIIDPNISDTAIKEMREEISAFEAEVDAVLSESNAVTIVTVELSD